MNVRAWVLVAALASASPALAQNAGTVTQNAFAIGKGAGQSGYASLLCGSSQLPIGQAGVPACHSLSGEASMTNAGVVSLTRSITPTWTGLHTFSQGVAISGAQNISESPTGNPTGGSLLTTYSSLNVQANTAQSGNREYLVNFGMTASLGTGVSTVGNADKVTLYTGMVCNTGAIACWAFNPLITLGSSPSGDFGSAQNTEFDINNNSGTDYNTGAGPTGFNAPFTSGISIASGGTNKVGAAMWVSAATSSDKFVRGILFANNSVSQADIQSGNNSPVFLDDWGVHTYGADFRHATFSSANTAAIRVPSGSGINFRNAADTTDLSLITSDPVNNVLVNYGGSGSIFLAGSGNVLPGADNAQALGGASPYRWTSVNAMAFYAYGATSGSVKLVPPAVAGSNTLTLPAVTDTLAGQSLANGGTGGSLTATSGGVACFTSTSQMTSSGALTANRVLIGGGAGACPTVSLVSVTTLNGITLNLGSTSSDYGPAITGANTANDGTGPLWQFTKNRGGGAAQAGDVAFWLQGLAYDTGSANREGADYQMITTAVGSGAGTVQMKHVWQTANGSSVAARMTLNASGGLDLGTGNDPGASALIAGASIKSQGATGGIGYATGAGGAVTQVTSRTTGVTLNTVSGAITLVSAAGSATPATFTVTDSAVAANDVIKVTQQTGSNLYEIFVTKIASGSFNITFFTTGGTTTEQPVFNFVVIKGVNS